MNLLSCTYFSTLQFLLFFACFLLQAYGFLVPLEPSACPIHLEADSFTVGRSVHNNFVIKEHPKLTNFQAS